MSSETAESQDPTLELVLPWKVHAKQRPRGGKNGVVYTPKATKDAEKIVKQSFVDCMGENFPPLAGPVAVELSLGNDEILFRIAPHAEHEHRKLRGDIDNYAKTILDALNGVAYYDDRQIERLTVVKL